MHLLIVEDDSRVASSLTQGLQESGYQTLWHDTAEAAVRSIQGSPVDLVVLDLGLPGKDGFHVLEYLKTNNSQIPVIILTARDTIDDKVKGLDAGADDYLVKPFAFPELLARIRASLRRAGERHATVIEIADLRINVLERTAYRADRALDLTPREFDLLRYLASHTSQPVSRDMLAHDVWQVNSRATPLDNVIDVHICHLRNAIDQDGTPPLIHTIRGVGFVLEDRS
jgi:two-component system copper resistance phosphate regulon response regulator CusR